MDKPSTDRQIRFCPYCFQQQFNVAEIKGDKVYCEICGVDVEVRELVKA
ncbi:MAG: hypothetical protein ACE147_07790 [Candidatus Methylomirabilales bacterium]